MNLDITKLLDEVEAEVKTLLKSAQEDAVRLAKAEDDKEESAKEKSKKEESVKEESAKEKSKKEESEVEKADDEEGSSYESQAPEVSETADMEDKVGGAEQAEDEDGILQELKQLDDEMLHELYQHIKMELMERMKAQEGASDAEAPEEKAVEEPAAQPEEEMKMSKSERERFRKLYKAESQLRLKDQEIAKLKKSLEEQEKGLAEFVEIVKTLIERPVVRAATGIHYIAKDGDLKKSDKAMSDEELKKAVDSLSADPKKLSTLKKSELDTIIDFYSGKNVKEKIMKIVNK